METNDLKKVYLGDSVYAEFKYGNIVLTTENGSVASNTTALEPSVIIALMSFLNYISLEGFKGKLK